MNRRIDPEAYDKETRLRKEILAACLRLRITAKNVAEKWEAKQRKS